MKKLNIISILYLISAILFAICGLQGKGIVFYFLSFTSLSIALSKRSIKE